MNCAAFILLLCINSICLSVSIGNDTPRQSVMKELSHIKFNLKPDDPIPQDTRSDDQDAIDSRLWGGVNLKKAAARIGEQMRELANEELGVTTLQGVFDSTDYVDEKLDLQARVIKIGEQVLSKLTAYRRLLGANRDLVENLYSFHLRSSISDSLTCCHLNSSLFSDKSSSSDGSSKGSVNSLQTSLHTVCDLLPDNHNRQMFNPGRNMTMKFSQNVQRHSAIKWQYFVSTDGIHNEFPAHLMSNTADIPCSRVHGYRHREVLVQTLSPTSKNLVVLMDVSSTLSANQLGSAKQLAKQLLLSLSPSDKVAVLALSQTVQTPPTLCSTHGLSQATDLTKFYLSNYIDKLTLTRSSSNHTLGLETAFSLLPTGENGTILYMSKGLLHSVDEPKHLFTAIADGNEQHGGRIVIHTYGLFDEGDVIIYEETLLRDISTQNFSKYEVTYSGSPIAPGTYHSVYSEDSVAAALNYLFTSKATRQELDQSEYPKLSRPYNDLIDGGLVVSMTMPCVADATVTSTVIGMVGIDISIEDLTDKIAHTNKQGMYAFLMDSKGNVIIHPSIERMLPNRETYSLINVRHYENIPEIESVVERMIATSEGKAELSVTRSSGGRDEGDPHSETYIYSWFRITHTPYIVVMRALKGNTPLHVISDSSASESMVYHRLDLGQLPSHDTCLHFKQLASFSTSAFFLSAKSFEEPYEHMSKPETRKMVANYLAYITDSSSYVSKPGLKEGVKNDVIAVSKIDKFWKQKEKSSPYKDFIVRRYVATPSGVVRSYPAVLTHKLYDPARTNWYSQSMRPPGRIVLTKPYVDVAGAGYIVTMGHSVYEGRSAALHTPKDPVAAVLAADFPASYFQRVLLELVPVCRASDLRCFLLDDMGYIITHPNLPLSGSLGAVEQQHLTHMEPLIANDILGHKSLVSKKQCNSFSDRTVQRYYHLNTRLTDTLTNLKAGEQCLRYQMSVIPGTNSFVVMVNETCDMRMSAFCPCSITDRLCLNCQRMEQSECECPCECPLTSGMCTGDLDPEKVSHDTCNLFTENNYLFKLPKTISSMMEQCVQPECGRHSTRLSCMGLVGCAWCDTNTDGKTPLDSGYCDVQQMCFGGVLGARTPYNDQLKVSSEKDMRNPLLKNTPVGPVTGAILCFVLIIVLGVYCYRHHIHRRSSPGGDTHDTSNCSSGYNHDTDGYVYHELPAVAGPSRPNTAHMNMVELDRPLALAQHISPYQLNENYVPPRPVVTATESSDHGYSTMTAQEEAETASATSCRESVRSSRSKGSARSLSAMKLLPQLQKSARHTSGRHKVDDSDCKQLLPADCSAKEMCSLLPQTIEEQPEPDRALVT